jgi:hypothetical protein
MSVSSDVIKHNKSTQLRGSIISIVTVYGLDRGVGFRVPVGSRIFTSPYHPDWLWGPPNPSYPMGTGWALSQGVKRQGLEADHSPPTSAEVKKMWIYTATSPIHLHGTVLN